LSSDVLFSWIYALFLAIDANFRLKRKIVSSNTTDPSLSRGWAYFVEEGAYKELLAEKVDVLQEVRLLCDCYIGPHQFPLEIYVLQSQCRQYGGYEDQSGVSRYRSWDYRLCAS
jgi:hypothetical protein